ncbi:hypothetical protein N7373_15100 [Achromobacter mucicolens]|uniref:hypothetical protein n=1 Tax=Achromobacter mucicolens TaxID=1389922 RepID=UPI0024468623|nr:hypothetical protein [Achromobacter mucicolens]MDH0092778.1 hypothetical protein [Achromobacter mucicolens]
MISDLDLGKLDLNYDTFLRAAETDDELGTVLRLHLLLETYLEVARDALLQPEVKRFVGEPRNFGDKLGYAAVAGLPVPLAAVMHHVGKMRNKLAHRDESGIDAGDIKQLARLVNQLQPLTSNPDVWKPIEQGFLELPKKFPGKRWTFGGGDLRADFVMCFGKLWSVAMAWLIRAAANSGKGSA